MQFVRLEQIMASMCHVTTLRTVAWVVTTLLNIQLWHC